MGYQAFTEDELKVDNLLQKPFAELLKKKPKDLVIYNPRQAKWIKELLDMRLYFYKLFNLHINYFTYRHTLDTMTRRYMDIVFCYHYMLDHYHEANASSIEQLRFRFYWRRYQLELGCWLDKSKRGLKEYGYFFKHYDEHYGFGYFDMKETDRLDYFH